MKHKKYFWGNEKADLAMEEQNLPIFEIVRDVIAGDCAGGYIANDVELLDFGCHWGGFGKVMKSEGFTGNLVSFAGLEPSKSMRDRARNRIGGVYYANKESVPDFSATVVVGMESLYFEESFYRWMRWLQRVLKPGKNKSAAYVVLGSHGENTAWLRWREHLEEKFGHQSYVHDPMEMMEIAAREGFYVEHMPLPQPAVTRHRFTPRGRGTCHFESLEEEFLFRNVWKQLFIFYPR